jgi:hypothetical protein
MMMIVTAFMVVLGRSTIYVVCSLCFAYVSHTHLSLSHTDNVIEMIDHNQRIIVLLLVVLLYGYTRANHEHFEFTYHLHLLINIKRK